MQLRKKWTVPTVVVLAAVLNLNLVSFASTPTDDVAPNIIPQPYLTEPALSPDKKEIAFVFRW